MAEQHEASSPARLQLHLVHPYKLEVRRHPRVRRLLDDGYRIELLQRLTDREVLVTLCRTDGAPAA